MTKPLPVNAFTPAAAAARQEIEYLRRLYARATDLIALKTEASLKEGLTIYRRIFTEDAVNRAGDPENQLIAHGPDGWADVVRAALARYDVTQHLIGSQIVEFDGLEKNDAGMTTSGTARMSSYLNAWHSTKDMAWIFIGTYHDKVRFVPDIGWQIYDMTLERISSDTRTLSPDPE